MGLKFISVTILCIVTSAAAYADGKYNCTDSSLGLTNQLTIQGSGTDAKIHIQNSLMAGDITYNDAYTKEALQPGYDVFSGMITDNLDNPPDQLEGVFFIQPSLLSGGLGSMEQMGDDSFIVLDCTKTQ